MSISSVVVVTEINIIFRSIYLRWIFVTIRIRNGNICSSRETKSPKQCRFINNIGLRDFRVAFYVFLSFFEGRAYNSINMWTNHCVHLALRIGNSDTAARYGYADIFEFLIVVNINKYEYIYKLKIFRKKLL